MPQVNLYAAELKSAMSRAVTGNNSTNRIWGDYSFYLHNGVSGGELRVQKSALDRMGKVVISREENTTCFSKLKTTDGYEKQGIGSLVIALGVMFAICKDDQYLKLGEPDTSGGHFWTSIGLHEGRNLTSTVLNKMLEAQRQLASKLGVTIDQSAFLVDLHPTCKRKSSGRVRSNSTGL